MGYDFSIGVPVIAEDGLIKHHEIEDSEASYTWNGNGATYEAFSKTGSDFKILTECFAYPKCIDVIEPLEFAIAELENNKEYYRKYDPENGWGDLDSNIRFLKHILKWCKKIPYGVVIMC